MGHVLRIDQNHDVVTRYGQAFRHRLVFRDFAGDFPNHTLAECLDDEATGEKLREHFHQSSPEFVSAMGHGQYAAIYGQDQLPLWDAGDDLAQLTGVLVHLLSCQTGGILGRRMVESGAVAFWGYTTNFVFFHRSPEPIDLATDDLAEIYFRMDAIIDRGILSGASSNEIHESITNYVAAVLPQLTDSMHRAQLLDNYVHLVCPSTSWGDSTARLT